MKICLPIKKITNEASTPAMSIHNNPHQTPKIEPAASAKIDSGNMHVVAKIKRAIKKMNMVDFAPLLKLEVHVNQEKKILEI